MEPSNSLDNEIQHSHASTEFDSLSVDAKKVPNTLLERLIREVKTEAQPSVIAYNRTHNRHNRGR